MRSLQVHILLLLSLASDPVWVEFLGGKLERDPHGSLTGIALRGTWVTDSDLDTLRELQTLERLDLSLTRVTDQGLLRLKGLQNVRDLNLYYAELITDEGAAALRNWKRLERLNLSGTKVTDTTLSLVSTITGLVALDIGFAQITDAGLQHLSSLSGLRELRLGGNKLTEKGLRILGSLPALERLDLSGRQRTDSGLWSVSVTDLGIDPIGALYHLRELNLGGTQISASGLEKLARLTKLEKLNLFGARRIGDDAIPCLLALPSLRWVDLKETAITRESVQKLRGSNPRVVVLWD